MSLKALAQKPLNSHHIHPAKSQNLEYAETVASQTAIELVVEMNHFYTKARESIETASETSVEEIP